MSRPQSTKAPDKKAKKHAQREYLLDAARELLAHFSHRNLDALLKVTKNTLEGLRKRITSSSMVHYIGGTLLDCNIRLPLSMYSEREMCNIFSILKSNIACIDHLNMSNGLITYASI